MAGERNYGDPETPEALEQRSQLLRFAALAEQERNVARTDDPEIAWSALIGWRKIAYYPSTLESPDVRVAAILRPMIPGLPTPETITRPVALRAAVDQFEKVEARLTPEACRANALRFEPGRFRSRLQNYVETQWRQCQAQDEEKIHDQNHTHRCHGSWHSQNS